MKHESPNGSAMRDVIAPEQRPKWAAPVVALAGKQPKIMLAPTLLAVVISVSSTTGLGIGGSWFDEQRILATVALVLVAGYYICRNARRLGMTAGSFALLMVGLLGLLSALISERPAVALAEWGTLFLIGALVVTAVSCKSEVIARTTVLVACVISTAYLAGVAGNYISSLLLGLGLDGQTLLVGFSNPKFPAQLEALVAPLFALVVLRARNGFWRVSAYTIASLWWMLIVGSGSRTAWISLGCAAGVACLLGMEGFRWLRMQTMFAMAGVVLWIALFHVVPRALDLPAPIDHEGVFTLASLAPRWTLWELAISLAIAHPLTGVGPMHFAYDYNLIAAHPHNFWLQLAAEWGLPAALLTAAATMGLILRAALAVRREENPQSAAMGTALTTAVVVWIVGTQADGFMVVPTSQLASTILLMLTVSWLRSREPSSAVGIPTNGSKTARLYLFLSLVAVTVLAALPLTDFGKPTTREVAWRQTHSKDLLLPRFWQQGWIGPDQDPLSAPAQAVRRR